MSEPRPAYRTNGAGSSCRICGRSRAANGTFITPLIGESSDYLDELAHPNRTLARLTDRRVQNLPAADGVDALRSIYRNDDPFTRIETEDRGYNLIELNCPYLRFATELTGDPDKRPNAYDFAQPIPIKRIGTVKLPVTVNDVRVELPAVQAQGEALEEKYEFFILDDEKNPLMLKFRLGIGSVPPPDAAALEFCKMLKEMPQFKGDPEVAQKIARYGCNRTSPADRDVLRVVKITYRCGASMPPMQGGGGGAGTGAAPGVEKQLAENRRADVYSIYFSFNSDNIRPESEPTLKEIADVMRKHADWSLNVNGHTDNVASDDYNLELSQRRAAAVKDALVKRYKIDANRLITGGMGKSQPKDTNDTVEGRARNRRVELVRL